MELIIILLLVIILLILSLSFFYFIRKSIYLTQKESEFIKFTFKIYKEYAMELGVQSVEMHDKLVKELDKLEIKLDKKTRKD